MINREYISCTESAKEIRAALKAAFPGVKFSVRSHTYSMGASVDVQWTDGPTVKSVEAVTKRFEGKSFDGMQDLASYNNLLVVGEEGTLRNVHYGSDYVCCSRHFSAEFYTLIAREVSERYGVEMPEIMPPTKYYGASIRDSGLTVGDTGEPLCRVVRQVASERAA